MIVENKQEPDRKYRCCKCKELKIKEIEKCISLCANCHRELHASERNND